MEEREYVGRHSGEDLDKQISRVKDGTVVTDNTDKELDKNSHRPLANSTVANALSSIDNKHIVLNYDIDAESLVAGGSYLATLTNDNYTELVSNIINDTTSVIDVVITPRGTGNPQVVRVTKVSTFGPSSAPLGVELWGEYRFISLVNNQGREVNNGGLQRISISQNLNDNTVTISVGEILPNSNVFALDYTFIGSSWDDENATLSPRTEYKNVYLWIKTNVLNQVVVRISPAYANVRGTFLTDNIYFSGTGLVLTGRIWLDDKKKWIKLTITHNADHTVTFTKEYEYLNGYVFRATMDGATLALTFPLPEEDYYEENAAECNKLWALYSSSSDEFNRVPISIVAKMEGVTGGGPVIPIDVRFVQNPDSTSMTFCCSLFSGNIQRYSVLTCMWSETDSLWIFRAGFSFTNEFPTLEPESRKIPDANLRTPIYSLVCTLENGTSLILDPAFSATNNETLARMYLMQDKSNAQPSGNVELIVNTTGSNDRYRGFLSYHARSRTWVGNITNFPFTTDNYVEYISGFSFSINVAKNGETYTIGSSVCSLRLLGEEHSNQKYISTTPSMAYSLSQQANARGNMGIHQIVLQHNGMIDKVTMAATDATGYENSNRVAYKRMANACKVNTNELFIVTLFIDGSFTVSGLVRAANLETWNGLLLDSVYTPSSNFGAAIRLYSISVDVEAVIEAVRIGDYSGIAWRYTTITLPEYGGLLNEINKINTKLKELTTK